MAVGKIAIPFPAGGVNRKVGYQSGNVQTTPHAINVVLDDSSERRSRGGSRVGMSKRIPTPIPGLPVLLEVVTVRDLDDAAGYQFIVTATANATYKSVVTRVTGPPVVYQETLSHLLNVSAELAVGAVRRGASTVYRGMVITAPVPVIIVEGNGTLTNGSLVSGSVANWTVLGISSSHHVVEITNNAGAGTFATASVSLGSILLTNTSLQGGCHFRVVSSLKILDPVGSTISRLIPSAGFVPYSPSILSTYLDRLVVAVGNVVCMSRQGDATNYNYGLDSRDAGRAVAFTLGDAGQPGETIIAIVSKGYEYLAMFTEDSLWVMRGDPASDVRLVNISSRSGCVDSEAWCCGSLGELYFLSKTGLHVVSPSSGEPPQLIGDDALPFELRGVDRFNYSVTLCYDPQESGVYIFRTPKDGSQGIHWWFDVRNGSFWRLQFSSAGHQPVFAVSYSGSPTAQPRSVLACVDGYIRQLGGVSDDGLDIVSEIVLGPYEMSGDTFSDAILSQIITQISSGLSGVTLQIYASDTAEAATNRAIAATDPNFSVTVVPGRSLTHRPRIRGNSFCIRLSGIGNWAFESLTAIVSPTGQHRG